MMMSAFGNWHAAVGANRDVRTADMREVTQLPPGERGEDQED